MSYHIEINEYQRRLIMKALTSTDVNQFSQAPGSGDAFDTGGRLAARGARAAAPARIRSVGDVQGIRAASGEILICKLRGGFGGVDGRRNSSAPRGVPGERA
jgi:hypothetical protein